MDPPWEQGTLVLMADTLPRVDAVLDVCDARFAAGAHAAHLQALLEIGTAVRATQDPWRLAKWHYWVGFLACCTGRHPEMTIAHCATARGIAQETGYDEILPFVECCLAQALLMTGPLAEAQACGQRALATFEARGNTWWACRTLWHLSGIAKATGAFAESVSYCQRALAHGRGIKDHRLIIAGLWRMGSAFIYAGAYRAGVQWCETAQALVPSPFDAAMMQGVHGRGLAKLGAFTEGIAQIREALAWLLQASLIHAQCLVTLYLVEAYADSGDQTRAGTLAHGLIVTSRAHGYRILEQQAQRQLGNLRTVCITEQPRHKGVSDVIDGTEKRLRRNDRESQPVYVPQCRPSWDGACP